MKDHYAGGYGALVLKGLNNRVLENEAAFFLPHLKLDMYLLDCGCGPGALTVQLAQRLCKGQVTGIDREGSQLQMGRDRAKTEGLSNVSFEEANLYALPFEDRSFDAVFAHAVVYYLSEPDTALAEIYRVLKPGGVFGIRDTDTGGDIVFPTDPLLEQALALMEKVLRHSGGSTEFGRMHRTVLRRGGFENIAASASYHSCGTPDQIQDWSAYCQYFLMELHTKVIVDQGWVSEDELKGMAHALQRWGDNPDAFFARCRCEAVAWKPVNQ